MTVAAQDFVYDPFAPEVLANPLPFYEVLRREHPVYYSEKYDTYFLSRFEEIREFLVINDGTFVPSEGTLPSVEALLEHHDGATTHDAPTDPHLAPWHFHGSPLYDQIRKAHTKQYRPKEVMALEPVMREVARERLDLLLPRGEFDLVQQYAGIVSAAVTCHLFRLPRSEAKDVLDTVNASMRTDHEHGSPDVAELFARLTGFIEPGVRARRREGANGEWQLVDGLIDFRLEGEEVRRDLDGRPVAGERALSDREIAEILVIVFAGTTETVPKVVGHGLWELQKRPEQLAEVRADVEANAPLVVEEIIRFCAPTQWFLRTVRKPTELFGRRLKPGQRVAYLAGSAGRDEAEYGEDAAEFRWNRKPRRLLSFGHGRSFCVGAHLTRLEARVLVEEFLKRVPEFEVHADKAARPPTNFQWSWIKVPISVPIPE